MGTCCSKDFQRDGEDDGQKLRNITALDPLEASECAVATENTGQDREEHEPGIADGFLTPNDSRPLVPDESAGASSSNPVLPSPSSSWYYSARIQRMIEKRGESSSELEFDVESSKVHWSEMDPTSQTEDSGEINRKYFEELMLKQEKRIAEKYKSGGGRGLIREVDGLVVGNKIAEGGQAEIYEADGEIAGLIDYGEEGAYVVKVFKAGCLLQDLEKQWPPGLLNAYQESLTQWEAFHFLHCATLLRDERFSGRVAFVMDRCWGDLRTLIDQQMIQSNNQGPLFTTKQVLHFMLLITSHMCHLHRQKPPVLHKDLKAANVLVKGTTCTLLNESGTYNGTVADYECSVGVVGTGFWRAPEILQQLKNRIPSSNLEFTEKCDVYSFGMTCYELVTGRIPFEGHPTSDYDLVLNGNRPELPPDLNPLIGFLIIQCWHPDPSERPYFIGIGKYVIELLCLPWQ